MKLAVLLQLSNAADSIKPLIEQYKTMNIDEAIILLDQTTDNSMEVIKGLQEECPDFITEVFDATPYKNAMHEGINMSILMNLANKRGIDYVVHGGRNYRWIPNNLKGFKEKIESYDQAGVTHIFVKWYAMWKPGPKGGYEGGYYRVDGTFNPSIRAWCGIHKVQRHNWFKMVVAHDMHPQAPYENRAYLFDYAYMNIGDMNVENREARVKLYKLKAYGMDDPGVPKDYSHLITPDKDVLLKPYNAMEMIPKNIMDWATLDVSDVVKGDEV